MKKSTTLPALETVASRFSPETLRLIEKKFLEELAVQWKKPDASLQDKICPSDAPKRGSRKVRNLVKTQNAWHWEAIMATVYTVDMCAKTLSLQLDIDQKEVNDMIEEMLTVWTVQDLFLFVESHLFADPKQSAKNLTVEAVRTQVIASLRAIRDLDERIVVTDADPFTIGLDLDARDIQAQLLFDVEECVIDVEEGLGLPQLSPESYPSIDMLQGTIGAFVQSLHRQYLAISA